MGGGANLNSPNKKKVLSMILLSLFCITLIGAGTYALWNSELLTGNNNITTGQVKMSYTETNEIGMNNALPMKDEEGKLLTNYFDFSVLSYIKTRANDSTVRKINYNVVLEPISVDNPLGDNEIKVYLTMVKDGTESVVVEPTTIDNLNNYILKSQEESFSNNKGEVITNYRLRAWLDSSVDMNKLNTKSYSYKFRVNVNNDAVKSNLDKSGANNPVLASNMIPVYYDETSSSWKKADSTNSIESNKWYDYDNKMWANAVTVSDTNRATYLSADAGTTISMDDINTMWVWIPRYTYTYLNTNTPEEIKIKFENGTSSSGTIKCTDAINQTDSDGNTISEICTDTTNGSLIAGKSTYTHPAFTFGDQELTGIWVGKFELTGTIDDITIKPNLTSVRSQTVSSFATNIMNMKNSGNKYGFSGSDDTHMMKNMEWGAVAYLSHSKYGINKEVALNSNESYTTGCGPQSEGSTSSGTICNAYTTTLGQSASTTGNVYGIYDMSGGTDEYVMGNIVNPSGAMFSSSSGFTTYPESKYYDKYSYVESETGYTKGKLGDATKEMAPTSSSFSTWYSEYASFPGSGYSWFVRGGYCINGVVAGLFYFSDNDGSAYFNYSARAVVLGLGAQ